MNAQTISRPFLAILAAVMLDGRVAGAAMTDLGTLPGYTYSNAYGVNDSGQVVGIAASDTASRPFLYSGGVMTDLGTLGGSCGEAHAINSAGQVVGSSCTGAPLFQEHAFLYSGGVMTDLGAPGGDKSVAHDINDSGQIVGSLRVSPLCNHAFVYSGGVMTDLGTLSGEHCRHTEALAINNSGQIVGYGAMTTPPYYAHAFLYDSGVWTDLGTLPGGLVSRATGINDDGDVVGWSWVADGTPHAFLYRDGVMTDLGTLGGPWSEARAINNNGEIVGYTHLTGPETRILFERDDVMYAIDATISSNPVANANAISNNGYIVGEAYSTNGQQHGFLFNVHDGVIDPYDECDDENAVDGDGCSASSKVETCWSCTGEPSICTPMTASTSCDDGEFCNGVDTCDGAGSCLHPGDPCPGTQCNTCQEAFGSCFDAFATGCALGGVCGDAACNGAGTCVQTSKCEGPFAAPTCSDTLDNDTDTFIDAADSDCAAIHEGPAGDPTCTNGTDDDADGAIDGADRGCQPSPPEVCNGFDDDTNGTVDEGFADLDDDGIADCVDPDRDNDGVEDRTDNCPAASNPSQTDSDGDGSGDTCDEGVPPVVNAPSAVSVLVDGQFEPAAGEWADVFPVTFLNGTSKAYTVLDQDEGAISILYDFSLSTNRLAIGDEVGPVTLKSGDNIFHVYVIQGGADSDFTPHPVSSSGGVGDTVRVVLNGLPFDNSGGCFSAAVDFNTTSPNFTEGHNVVELSARVIGTPGGCYSPAATFWSATLPGVQPVPASLRAMRSPGATLFTVYESYVQIDTEEGVTTLAPIGADPNVDHFKCYGSSDEKNPAFVPATVSLADQFDEKSTNVRKPSQVCSPAAKNGAGINDPRTSLVCYSIKDAKDQAKFEGASVQISNTLGTTQLKLIKASQVCVPSRVNGQASLLLRDSFKCYKVSDRKNPKFTPADVTLSDRFGDTTTNVSKPAMLCSPVDLDSTGTLLPASHLACYKIKDTEPFMAAGLEATNAVFGTLQLAVKKPSLLCVPSTLTVLP